MDHLPISVLALPQIAEEETGNVNENALIDRYRAFRLAMLRSDPDSFASSYMEESQQGREFWRKRLSNPKAVHFVAISASPLSMQQEPLDAALDADWMGMTAIIGPNETDHAAASASTSPWERVSKDDGNVETAQSLIPTGSDDAGRSLIYHFGATYTMPDSRRRGVGAAMFYTALRAAEDGCKDRELKEMICTIHVSEDNMSARKLYEKAGFVKIAEENYTPRPIESGPREEKAVLVMESRKTL